MAIKLSANYSKKLGLPNFSSHSFSAAIEIELSDITQAEEEIQKLYQLLQHSVDQEIQNPGFVPEPAATNGNGHKPNGRNYHLNGNGRVHKPSNGSQQPKVITDQWTCTDGQRGFILRIINENNLQKPEVEDLSQQLFGVGVKEIDKMQASQLIEELLIKVGKPPRQHRWQQHRNPQPQHA